MPTYSPLQSIVLTNSTTTSVTFYGIDQSYQDLKLVVNMADDTGSGYMYLQFNGDSGNNYSSTGLYGNGSSATAGRQTSTATSYILNDSTTTIGATTLTIEIPSYTNTTTYKTYLTKQSDPARVDIKAHFWRATPQAIKSITLTSAYNLLAGTTFDLYGISPVNAKVAAASGGTGIYYDSSYVYHVFTGSGVFTPNRNLSCDILSVAGGGGGGSRFGGGGGAGGYLTFSSQLFTSGTAYAVVVGAGGPGGLGSGGGGTSGANAGINGTNSQLAALTASIGGGGGGRGDSGAGASGGSGGGSAGRFAASGGSPTSGQGNAGGSADGNAPYRGSGGGGASTSGTIASSGGTGGNGSYNSISGGAATGFGQLSSGNYYFAGGGGGGGSYDGNTIPGVGGLGGGGTGGTVALPGIGVSGTTNTGGGGGGGSYNASDGNSAGGSGGSGIVIVRYAR